MKKYILTLIFLTLVIGGAALYRHTLVFEESTEVVTIVTEDEQNENREEPQVVAEGLVIPWDIAFLPEGGMLITERGGRVVHIDADGEQTNISISEVRARGEGGLLGLTLHPDFKENSYLYLYRTSALEGESTNEVVRYTYDSTTSALRNETVIVGGIDGSLFHNGGRVRFGPDGHLYIATGDAQEPSQAQDTHSLSGKILRVTDTGAPLPDNPFSNEVYSYGHRNPQGLTWDERGHLWSTEHGRSGVLSGLDELNLIEKGANYGWPESQGDVVLEGTRAPALHSGEDVTWAPADALFWDGSVFFTGLRGKTLYEAVLNEAGDGVLELREHFVGTYGRLRTVVLGPDGMFYLMTSNRDGRGDVGEGDDKLIRIDPQMFR